MMKAALVGIAAMAACTSAAYPTTYPYDNEDWGSTGYSPIDTPAGTPDGSYVPASDPGGYIYYYFANADFMLTDDDFTSPTFFGEDSNAPWSPTQTGAIRYLLVQFGASADLPADTWNCTGKGTVFDEADFTGVVATDTICEQGSCCSGLMGLPKFSDDQMTWHGSMNDRHGNNACGDLQEEVYCIVVGGDYQTNCFDWFTNPSDRTYMFICPDSFAIYYLSCTVYLGNYVPVYDVFEPPAYYDSITQEEKITSDAQYFVGDRVCHPYSYFHPSEGAASATDGAASATDGGDASAASASAASAASESDSSAALVASTVLALFLAL